MKKLRKLMFLLLLMILSTLNLPYINYAEENEEEDDYIVELVLTADQTNPLYGNAGGLTGGEMTPEYIGYSAVSQSTGEDGTATEEIIGNNVKYSYSIGNSPVQITVTTYDGLYIYLSEFCYNMPTPEDFGAESVNVSNGYKWDEGEESEYLQAYAEWQEDQTGIYNENGWTIQLDATGRELTISRETRKASQEGYKKTTTIEFWLKPVPANYIYSQLDHIDVFSGEHNDEVVFDQNGNEVHLIQDAVIGQRPEKKVTTIIDKIKYYIARFKEPIFLFTSFLYGIAIFTTMLGIAINTFKLATSSSHPVYRRDAVINLLTSFICASLLGGIVLFSKLIMDICF